MDLAGGAGGCLIPRVFWRFLAPAVVDKKMHPYEAAAAGAPRY